MKAGMKKCISYLLTAVFVISAVLSAGGLQKKQVRAAEKFHIDFIRGRRDAALLQYGDGDSARYALIDAGPDYYTRTNGSKVDTSERVHKYLTDHKVTKLEFVLLTHPHRDHIAGMINILEDENIKIDKIYGNNFDLRYSSSGNQIFG